MLLLLIFNLITLISAKILYGIEDIAGNNIRTRNGAENVNYIQNGGDGYVIGEPLWVLRLNNDGWINFKLTLGTSEAQEDFYNAVAPMIREAGPRQIATKVLNQNDYQQRNKTQQASNGQSTRSEKDLINEITKLINKFALSINIEPDSYLSDKEIQKDPSIAIYFKGPYSCIIVILGDKQWHYIPQTPPFPAWFYENHDTFEAPLKIPEHTRYAFLQVLLRLLKLILSYPL